MTIISLKGTAHEIQNSLSHRTIKLFSVIRSVCEISDVPRKCKTVLIYSNLSCKTNLFFICMF